MARPIDDVLAVLRLKEAGKTDAEVSRLSGVPTNTIRAWRRIGPSSQAKAVLAGIELCADCGLPKHRFEELAPELYAYVLGLYLGDGCLAAVRRSWNLRLTLDRAYPGIIDEASQAIEALRGHATAATPSRRDGSVVVSSNWKAWRCLFPQHGPGRKHERPIVLTEWQNEIAAKAPGRLLRGLIQTDGWRGTNQVRSKGKAYEYPRYQFSNRSDDIRRIFTDACDALGIEWSPWTQYHVSVAKRAAVARLDEFVGPKT